MHLTASPDGRWVALDLGASEDERAATWLIDVRRKVAPRRLARMTDPSFSLDSTRLALTRNSILMTGAMDTLTLDLRRDTWHLLRKGTSQPVWSSDGREMALVEDSNTSADGAGAGLVLDAHTGAVRYRSPFASVSLAEPILSPDGRYFALLTDISRPKLGHQIIDRKTGKLVAEDFDYPRRLPAELLGWSPDSKYLLWNWRIPDPNNDGSWMGDEVGVTTLHPKSMRHRVGPGHSPQFTPDSAFLLWLQPAHRGIRVYPATLRYTTNDAKQAPVTLLSSVDAYTICPGNHTVRYTETM